jgi:hypothetical protein
MTVEQWVIEEAAEIKRQDNELSDYKICLKLTQGVIASYAYEMQRIGQLLWDERIDDKEGDRLKAEVRANRDADSKAVLAWYDWAYEGRPE